ncbi:extracellular solute-binding protein [Marinivivus vitaminiproducens]|uniref:extracellular solute-binding protein n=1 Tax=Marinivivus vitaminiproducens TaxID=3035935 RepID=UPI0027A7FD08|nr:extracellular solute-binding protein [Geminicoccaceae bacterium SCSIO 64248]
MRNKARDLATAFAQGRLDRRELFRHMGRLGVGAATMGLLVNRAQTSALAADLDWKAYEGEQITLLLNKHPYVDAMIANLDSFKQLTGMEVRYDVFPEDVYFDKVTAALSSGSSQYDAFMTGAYQTWQSGPAGWVDDLNEYLTDDSLTAPAYNWTDIQENLRASTSWSGVPGAPLGGADAKQWALPWAFELNSVSYNRRLFDAAGVQPPQNLPDMLEVAGRLNNPSENVYGISVRGSRSWATIHPGYLSAFSSYGARDFEVADGKLKAAMNSAAGKEMTALWVKMIQDSGPRNWATYTWYQVGADLGAGAAAMIYDADIQGYFMNGGDVREKGNIGFHAFAADPSAQAPTPNVWIWSLAMNSYGSQKEAAWYFLQWATGTEHALFGATKMDFVNPVRQSVWQDEAFRDRMAKSYPGYLEQYEASAPNAKIYFTPQPLFPTVTTEWSASLQRMVANEIPVDEGLDQLAESIDRQMTAAGLG